MTQDLWVFQPLLIVDPVVKGIFTSCKETDNCPPCSIPEKVTHDRTKKQLLVKMQY